MSAERRGGRRVWGPPPWLKFSLPDLGGRTKIGQGTSRLSSSWPVLDPRARGLRCQGPRASWIPRTSEGAGKWDTWDPLTWGLFLLTEHAPQALPWSGDRTHLACPGWDSWSRVSPALCSAPFAGSEGVAGQSYTTSGEGASSWSRAPAATSSTNWDCSIGPDGATYWGKGLGGEQRADYTTSWGGPAGSDYPTSWDSGLHTDCTTSSKEYRSSDVTTSSELRQQSDSAILARGSRTNHRGERSVRLRREGMKPESGEARLRRHRE